MVNTIHEYQWIKLPLSSAELEAVTGLTPRMQKDWRSRGLLAKAGSRTEIYSPREVAALLFLQALRPYVPLPLETLLKHAHRVAPQVLWFMFVDFPAWQFVGSPAERLKFEALMRDRDDDLVEDCKSIIGMPRRWQAHNYSVWLEGDWQETSSLHDFLDENEHHHPFLLIIDHFALGRRFAETLPRPLYEVRLKTKRGRGR